MEEATRIHLEARLQMALARSFSQHGIDPVMSHAQVGYEPRIGEMVGELTALLLTGGVISTMVKEAEFVPVTWWDHFKLRWFPEWLRKWFPVSTREIATRIEEYHTCPHTSGREPARKHIDWMVGDNTIEVRDP